MDLSTKKKLLIRLANRDRIIDNLSTRLHKRDKDFDDLKEKFDESMKEVRSIRESKRVLANINKSNEFEIIKLNVELEKTRTKNRSLENEVKTLTENLLYCKKSLYDFQTQLSKNQQQMTGLLKQLEINKKKSYEKISDYKEKLAAAHKELNIFQKAAADKYEKLDTDLKRRTVECQKYETIITTQEQEICKLNLDNETLDKNVSGLSKNLKEEKAKYEKLEEVCNKYKEDLKRAFVNPQVNNIRTLRNQLHHYKKALAEKEAVIQRNQTVIQELQGKVTQQEKDESIKLYLENNDVKKLKEELISLTDANLELLKRLSGKEYYIKTLKDEIRELEIQKKRKLRKITRPVC